MFESITVKAFKSLTNENLKLSPLTIIAGPNSAGKSSLLQALLIGSLGKQTKPDILTDFFNYNIVFNRYMPSGDIVIKITDNKKEQITVIKEKNDTESNNNIAHQRIFENNLFVLAASRNSLSKYEIIPDDSDKFGVNGEFTAGTLNKMHDKPIAENLRSKKADSETLKSQLSYWMTEITGSKCLVKTQPIDESRVRVLFDIDGEEDFTTNNVGIGNNYLVKLLVMCLLAKKDDVLLIENPEIHLHPKAQAKLGTFFSHLANSGIQTIIETHCEHFIDGIRYEVFNKRLNNKNVEILYKSSIHNSFKTIFLNEKAFYCDESNNLCSFPDGFFDATLKELMEMC